MAFPQRTLMESVIDPLLMQSVQDGMVALLKAEIANQESLYLALPGSTQEIWDNDYKINQIVSGLNYPKDEGDFPLVNVYFEKVLEATNDNLKDVQADYMLNLDLYCFRKTAEDGSGNVIDGDTGADRRMNYLIAQVYKMLEAQINWWKGAFDFFESIAFIEWKKDVNHPNVQGIATAIPPLMARIVYSVKITESKEVNSGFNVNQFLTTLNVDDKDGGSVLVDQS